LGKSLWERNNTELKMSECPAEAGSGVFMYCAFQNINVALNKE
jgi:hypothetical protein